MTSPPRPSGRPDLPFRSRVEHAVAPWMERANAASRVLVFLVVLAMLVAGILVPHIGFVFSAVVALLVAFLVYYTWPRLTAPEKVLRLAVLAIIVAITLVQAFPRT